MPYFSFLDLSPYLLTLNFYACNKVVYKGTEFRTGYFVTVSNDTYSDVQLYEMRDLLLAENKLYIAGQKWQLNGYMKHFASFEVVGPSQHYEIIREENADGPPIHIHTIEQKRFIRLKNYFV